MSNVSYMFRSVILVCVCVCVLLEKLVGSVYSISFHCISIMISYL